MCECRAQSNQHPFLFFFFDILRGLFYAFGSHIFYARIELDCDGEREIEKKTTVPWCCKEQMQSSAVLGPKAAGHGDRRYCKRGCYSLPRRLPSSFFKFS